MTSIDKVKKIINTFAIDTTVPFSSVKIEDVPSDTVRKVLHRLHESGYITIVSRGHFKKVKPFRELLFVYGSLKKGFDNHSLISHHAKRLGKALTIKKFGMYEDSFGNYPYLINAPFYRIHGELYEIPREDLLEKIDAFEGAPDYYQREKILVKTHHGVQRAYVYIQATSSIPKDQEPLREWKNDIDYKINQLDNYLSNMVGA